MMLRAQTTIGGPETFKWVLPTFLDRSIANPGAGWMTDSEILAEKLDHARFDEWPTDQRETALAMLADWLDAQARLYPDADTPYEPADDAVLRDWLKARMS